MSAEHGTAEEDLDECLGAWASSYVTLQGQHMRCHAFTNDRDCNEVRYMIEDIQRRGDRREVAEIVFVERQR